MWVTLEDGLMRDFFVDWMLWYGVVWGGPRGVSKIWAMLFHTINSSADRAPSGHWYIIHRPVYIGDSNIRFKRVINVQITLDLTASSTF